MARTLDLKKWIEKVTDTLSSLNQGEILEATQSGKSIASGTTTSLCSITLPKGKWVVYGHCLYPSISNASGVRELAINTAVAIAHGYDHLGSMSTAASSNITMALNITETYDISTPTTIYLSTYHSQGSAITVGGIMRAVRVSGDFHVE